MQQIYPTTRSSGGSAQLLWIYLLILLLILLPGLLAILHTVRIQRRIERTKLENEDARLWLLFSKDCQRLRRLELHGRIITFVSIAGFIGFFVLWGFRNSIGTKSYTLWYIALSAFLIVFDFFSWIGASCRKAAESQRTLLRAKLSAAWPASVPGSQATASTQPAPQAGNVPSPQDSPPDTAREALELEYQKSLAAELRQKQQELQDIDMLGR